MIQKAATRANTAEDTLVWKFNCIPQWNIFCFVFLNMLRSSQVTRLLNAATYTTAFAVSKITSKVRTNFPLSLNTDKIYRCPAPSQCIHPHSMIIISEIFSPCLHRPLVHARETHFPWRWDPTTHTLIPKISLLKLGMGLKWGSCFIC